jgi:hypothetical protein
MKLYFDVGVAFGIACLAHGLRVDVVDTSNHLRIIIRAVAGRKPRVRGQSRELQRHRHEYRERRARRGSNSSLATRR